VCTIIQQGVTLALLKRQEAGSGTRKERK
jgi:hypothetical protein